MCHVDDSDISDNDLGDFAIFTVLCGQSSPGEILHSIFQYSVIKLFRSMREQSSSDLEDC